MLLLLKSLRASSIEVVQPDPDGAIQIGGNAVTYYRQVYSYPSGGLELGGDGTYISSISRVADGGVYLSGDDTPIVWSVASGQGQDGAILIGGDGGARALSIASGGMDGAITLGGDAVTYYRERYSYPSGGLKLGGDGVGSLILGVFSEPDGGVYLGGEAVAVQWSHASAAGAISSGGLGGGGVYLGGEAYRFEHTPDGSLVVGGDGIGVTIVTLSGQTFNIGTARHRGPTTQIEIMKAMKQRLIDSAVFVEPNIFIASDPMDARETITSHEKFCAILVGDKQQDQGQLAGGGTDADFKTEVFEIRVYTRLQLDRMGQQDIWTTQASKGAYAIARSAANKFQIHDLQDQAGTILVGEPTRILRIGNPIQKGNGIGYVPVSVEVKYTERHP